MAQNNRVIWSEGMFLRPHHYQQYTRYLENLLDQKTASINNFGWGFTTASLDQSMLGLGKLAIEQATGIFPDGTPFNMPADDKVPGAVDFPQDKKNTLVYLALPLRKPGQSELDRSRDKHSLARYSAEEQEISDNCSIGGKSAILQLGQLRTRIMLEDENRDDYACLGIARVVERRADGELLIDHNYIPPALDVHAAPELIRWLQELLAMLNHRATALASRLVGTGTQSSGEIADFLMLQSINRWVPVIEDVVNTKGMAPRSLFQLLISLAGEFATFVKADRRAPEFEHYDHTNLQAILEPVFMSLRQDLSVVLEQKAQEIPLKERRYGIRVATINDRSLMKDSQFVLAISASIASEELRTSVPPQIKIGPVEQIRQLVNAQLPGIRIRPLPIAPRQIPYHQGHVYFEIEQSGQLWSELETSGGIAIHLAGEFPELKMALWAIRS